jgi:hypothetical protein
MHGVSFPNRLAAFLTAFRGLGNRAAISAPILRQSLQP